jgi:DNA-binding CsgD family transcriptional regulator
MRKLSETDKKLIEISPAVVALVNPLIQISPIMHFGFLEFRSDGSYYGITSTPELYRIFQMEVGYGEAPAYQMHTIKRQGIHVMDLMPEETLQWGVGNKVTKLHHSFNYGHACKYVHTVQEGQIKKCLSFNFWGHIDDDSINHFFVNNTNLIKYFSRYFYRKIQSFFREIPPYRTKEKVEAFINGLSPYGVAIPKLLLAFSEKTHLSKRQIDIIAYYLKGNTAEETAKQLGVSLNTVQTHVQRMRVKLGSRTKAEMAIKLLEDGFFLPD